MNHPSFLIRTNHWYTYIRELENYWDFDHWPGRTYTDRGVLEHPGRTLIKDHKWVEHRSIIPGVKVKSHGLD